MSKGDFAPASQFVPIQFVRCSSQLSNFLQCCAQGLLLYHNDPGFANFDLAGPVAACTPKMLPKSSLSLKLTNWQNIHFCGVIVDFIKVRQHSSTFVNIRQHSSTLVKIDEILTNLDKNWSEKRWFAKFAKMQHFCDLWSVLRLFEIFPALQGAVRVRARVPLVRGKF